MQRRKEFSLLIAGGEKLVAPAVVNSAVTMTNTTTTENDRRFPKIESMTQNWDLADKTSFHSRWKSHASQGKGYKQEMGLDRCELIPET